MPPKPKKSGHPRPDITRSPSGGEQTFNPSSGHTAAFELPEKKPDFSGHPHFTLTTDASTRAALARGAQATATPEGKGTPTPVASGAHRMATPGRVIRRDKPTVLGQPPSPAPASTNTPPVRSQNKPIQVRRGQRGNGLDQGEGGNIPALRAPRLPDPSSPAALYRAMLEGGVVELEPGMTIETIKKINPQGTPRLPSPASAIGTTNPMFGTKTRGGGLVQVISTATSTDENISFGLLPPSNPDQATSLRQFVDNHDQLRLIEAKVNEFNPGTNKTRKKSVKGTCTQTFKHLACGTASGRWASAIFILLALGIAAWQIWDKLFRCKDEEFFDIITTVGTALVAIRNNLAGTPPNNALTTIDFTSGCQKLTKAIGFEGFDPILGARVTANGSQFFDLTSREEIAATISDGLCDAPVAGTLTAEGHTPIVLNRAGTIPPHKLFQTSLFPALPAASPLNFIPFDIRKEPDALDLPLNFRVPLNQPGLTFNDPANLKAIASGLRTSVSDSKTHLTINGLAADIVNTAAHYGFEVETDYGYPGTQFSTNITAEIEQCATWQPLSVPVTGINVPTPFAIDTTSCPTLYSLSNTNPCTPLSCYTASGSKYHSHQAIPTTSNGLYYTGISGSRMNISLLSSTLSTARLCFDPTLRPFGASFGQAGSIVFNEFNTTEISSSQFQVLPPVANTFNPPTTPNLNWPAITGRAPRDIFNPFAGFSFSNPNDFELITLTVTGDENLHIPGFTQFGNTFQKTARWEALQADLAGATYTVPPHASGESTTSPISSLVSYPNGDSASIVTNVEACGPYREPIATNAESSTTTNVFAQPFAGATLLPAIPEDASQTVVAHVFPGTGFSNAGAGNFTGSIVAAESFLQNTQIFDKNPTIGETHNSTSSFSIAYSIPQSCSLIVTTWSSTRTSIHTINHPQTITGTPAVISIPPTDTQTQVFASAFLEEPNDGELHLATLTIDPICGSITTINDPISDTLTFMAPPPWSSFGIAPPGGQKWTVIGTEAGVQTALRAVTAEAVDLDALAGAGTNDAFADTCKKATFCYGDHNGVEVCATADIFRRFEARRRLDEMKLPSGLLPFYNGKHSPYMAEVISKERAPVEA